MRYEVQTSGAVKHYEMDIEISIDPVFEIGLEFPKGPIRFNDLYPGAGPQENLVNVRVNSNLNRPYMVTQNISGPLTNERRNSIKYENFLIKVNLDQKRKGQQSKISDSYVPVNTSGEQVIYISSDGAPASFSVNYRVIPYVEISPGDYHTEITYTLSEI